jgi:hypothetical protein
MPNQSSKRTAYRRRLTPALGAMNKEDAIAKISHSLSTEEARIITPSGGSYPEYVEKLSRKLLACVIEPVEVKVTSTCIPAGDFEIYRNTKVWGIAQGGGSWLLTLENVNEFALGFGDDPMNIMMHGCSSPDALGEWCA